MRHLPALLALVALVVSAPALAQDMDHREGIVADHATAPLERPLDLTRSELERDHPMVARALDQPGVFIPARDDAEEDALPAFWSRMADHDGLRVDGQDWQITPAMPSQLYGDGAADSGPAPEGDASGPALLGLVAATGLAAAVASRRR